MSLTPNLAMSRGALRVPESQSSSHPLTLHPPTPRQDVPCPAPRMLQEGEDLWQEVSSMLRPQPGEGGS